MISFSWSFGSRLQRLFGTWKAAVEKAGFNYEAASGVRRWNRKLVAVRIRELAAEGISLNAKAIEERYPFLHCSAIKHFPRSWATAVRAAGFDPAACKVSRGRWDREKAEAWVRQRVERGRPILAGDAPSDLLDFVHRRLRTGWTEFVESLGIPYPGIKKRRDWTKSKVLAEIRRRKAAGEQMDYRAVYETYQALLQQAKKFFGTWDRARAAARA